MPPLHFLPWPRVLACLAGLLVLKVTGEVVLSYREYFPPDFQSDFLWGRESYFFGSYRWAFYSHIGSGPISLVLGLVLVNSRFRLRFPKWHRRLGRVQGMGVLLVLAPSGLWMAFYAEAGPVAGWGFGSLAIATGVCVALGWRAAVKRRFAEHQLWMWRCFLLLCSAVVLRLIGGAATVMNIQALWVDPLAAWACWLIPLAAFELNQVMTRRGQRALADTARAKRGAHAQPQPGTRSAANEPLATGEAHSSSSVSGSLPATEIIARR